MLSRKIAISLVIPSFNRASLIGETLDSALNQSMPFLEVIVIDDGSTDDTDAVLAKYAGKVRVIKVANGGVQRARNVGIEAAAGEYVAFCDSDDLLETKYVATASAWLESHEKCDSIYVNFVTFSDTKIDSDKFSRGPANFFEGATREGDFYHGIPDLYSRTLIYQPLFNSGSLVRREVCKSIGGYDTQFNGIGGEDYEFLLRLIDAVDIAVCTVPLARVRKHAGNDSTDNLRQVSGCVQILEYALQKHTGAKRYEGLVRRSINERRIDIFNNAFSQGAFDIVAATKPLIIDQPADLKFKLKWLITRLPAVLRVPVWKVLR